MFSDVCIVSFDVHVCACHRWSVDFVLDGL
jgi:hypothetical protein